MQILSEMSRRITSNRKKMFQMQKIKINKYPKTITLLILFLRSFGGIYAKGLDPDPQNGLSDQGLNYLLTVCSIKNLNGNILAPNNH